MTKKPKLKVAATIYHSDKPPRGKFVTLTHDIRVYKKASFGETRAIVTLILYAGTVVYKGADRKCRATRALVNKTEQIDRMNWQRKVKPGSIARSLRNDKFLYKPGQWVQPQHAYSFEHCECESGIHFFENRKDAENY